MEDCSDCEKAHRTKKAQERLDLIQKASELYKGHNYITIAIVETKNGKLGIREIGDESLQRLKTVEFISFVQGIASVPVH